MNATIYALDGSHVISEGLQSATVCGSALNEARLIARERRQSVVVEDAGTEECYRVTPGGHVWRAPRGWVPSWVAEALS